jgi:hypothetical protein
VGEECPETAIRGRPPAVSPSSASLGGIDAKGQRTRHVVVEGGSLAVRTVLGEQVHVVSSRG